MSNPDNPTFHPPTGDSLSAEGESHAERLERDPKYAADMREAISAVEAGNLTPFDEVRRRLGMGESSEAVHPYWQRPGLEDKVKKALQDHEAGNTIPWFPSLDSRDGIDDSDEGIEMAELRGLRPSSES